ncbi:MAG TPA: alpha/beta fold hydrolase [Terriglobales bacterium]|nr:alpha/beta fold hydrolase [Terriglobales bacterium]
MPAPGFDCSPFSLPGNDTGCLLIHGFTATPYDMRFFGEALHRCGFAVEAVCLPGHASRVEDMEAHSRHDWLAACAAGLHRLVLSTRRRVIVGQSLGALLALELAHRHPGEIDAVVAVSTALIAANPLLDWLAPMVPLLRPLLPASWRYIAKGESDIADPQARAQSQAYRRMPLQSIHQLHRLQREVRAALPDIHQPVLAIHSRQDHACPVSNVELLQSQLGGPVETLLLDNSFHVVSVDLDKQLAIDTICAFIRKSGP